MLVRARNKDFADKLALLKMDSKQVKFSPHGNPLTLWKILGLRKKAPFDVVITNMEKDIFMAGLVAKDSLRVTLCGGSGDFSGKTRDTWIRKNFARHIIFCSAYTQKETLKNNPWIKPSQGMVMPNPVTAELFSHPTRSFDKKKLVIGCLARLRVEKNQSLLLRAISNLPAELLAYIEKVKIGGVGPDEPMLRRLSTELGLEKIVSFDGFAHAPDFMKACDIHVLPSLSESQGLVTQEAMASGAVAVGSNIMGIAETISHGVDGLLFTSGDEMDLCQHLSKLIVDRNLRKKLSANGLETVATRFDAKIVGEKFLDLFKDLKENQTSE